MGFVKSFRGFGHSWVLFSAVPVTSCVSMGKPLSPASSKATSEFWDFQCLGPQSEPLWAGHWQLLSSASGAVCMWEKTNP